MQKIVYLIGTGATMAEMLRQGIESDITMRGIGNSVLEISKGIGGKYWRLQQELSLPPDQDIELMISLFEGFGACGSEDFLDVCSELRGLFRGYLVSQISDTRVRPTIVSGLLNMHKAYAGAMGHDGEELTGVLTINFDSLIDEAFSLVYGGVDYGYPFASDTYQRIDSMPPLLKLHGSFNWRISGSNLSVEAGYENQSSLDGWMPPSVYKKPHGDVFDKIWTRAGAILAECDVLRVVGSSLRNEDFALLSLLFLSQSRKRFTIELIVPEEVATGDVRDINDAGTGSPRGMMQRLSFLGNMKPLSTLPVFAWGGIQKYTPPEGDAVNFSLSSVLDNVFYGWVKKKVEEAERRIGESIVDEFIARMWEA